MMRREKGKKGDQLLSINVRCCSPSTQVWFFLLGHKATTPVPAPHVAMGCAYQWNVRKVMFGKRSLTPDFGLFCLKLPGKVIARQIMTQSLNDCVEPSCCQLRTLVSKFYMTE